MFIKHYEEVSTSGAVRAIGGDCSREPAEIPTLTGFSIP